MIKRLSALPSSLTSVPRSYLAVSVCFPLIDCLLAPNAYLAHVKTFLTKTCFFVYILYFSVNFTYFSLLSHQIFDDRLLYTSGELKLIWHHFEYPQEIFLRD